jgi:PAS domain S-box-containing protein
MSAAHAITLLIVEDSAVQAEMLRRLLLEAGYGVEIARDGAEGLARTRELHPSLVISDINMPRMDGYEMCAAIRAEAPISGIPVILVTTLSDPGYVMRGLQANADAYLTKPYNTATLLSWIENLLTRPPIPPVDRRKTEIWVHGEPKLIQVTPQRMMNLLVSIYENSLLQYRELLDAQNALEEMNATLETRVIEQTAAVHSSERRLRALLQHGEGLVLTTDPAGTMSFVGPTAAQLLGYSPEEMLGRRLQDFTHPDDQATLATILTNLRQPHSRLITFEQCCLGSDGKAVFVEVCAKNVLADPAIGGYVLNLRDISLRKKDEEHIRKLSLAVEQSPAMVVITDTAAKIEFVNEAYLRNTGYSRDELIGQNPRQMQSGKTAPAVYRQLWDSLNQGLSWQGEFVNKRKDGSEYIGATEISPIRLPGGRVTHYLSVQEDVSEKRRMEAELEQHRVHLEDLVQSRTVELNEARERAENANQAKGKFLASMSHEIRTPMNTVIGLTHLLRIKAEDHDQIDKLDKISRAGSHLLSVINNVLDQAKIDAGKLVLDERRINLHDITVNVVAMLQEAATTNHTRILVHHEHMAAVLYGDPTRLTQCLLNLASNAVKHTVDGSVTLRVRGVAEEAHRHLLRFEVVDTGIGIEPDILPKLFAPFEQGSPVSQMSPSTGLGLSITRRLANLMGGETGAESTPLAGSTFWFTAWLRKGEAGMTETGQTMSIVSAEILKPHVAGKRVLLVDDTPVNRLVGREMLEQAGIVVTEAADGLEAIDAIRKAQEAPYTLILMDMQMPRLGGIEATREIRALPNGKAIPIVAMTANAFGEDRDTCIAAGMNDHIAKPVEPNVLYATIGTWMGVQTAVAPGSPAQSHAKADGAAATDPLPHDLDFARLVIITQGKTAVMRGVLKQFMTHHQSDQENLCRHIDAGDYEAAFQVVHALKGSAGQIGATELHTTAKTIEAPLRNGQSPVATDIDEFSATLVSVMERVMAWLRDHPEETVSAVTDTPALRAELLARVRQLATLLDAADGQALFMVEDLARDLPSALGAAEMEGFAVVLSAVRRVDFDEAGKEMKAILPRLEAALA